MLDLFHTHGCEVFMQDNAMLPPISLKKWKITSNKSRLKWLS